MSNEQHIHERLREPSVQAVRNAFARVRAEGTFHWTEAEIDQCAVEVHDLIAAQEIAP